MERREERGEEERRRGGEEERRREERRRGGDEERGEEERRDLKEPRSCTAGKCFSSLLTPPTSAALVPLSNTQHL